MDKRQELVVPPLRAVILDYGDVISLPADPAVITWMAGVFGLADERFRQIYAAFRHDYDRGTVSAAEYWSSVSQAAGHELSDDSLGELRRADVAMWSRLNEGILAWADQLRAAGLKTAVLSNMHDDMVQHIRANAEWANRFDCLALSSALGMAKPEPDIFEHCLKLLDVAAAEAIFVDDREANVRSAKMLGIRGLCAPTPQRLRAELEAINFSPLPRV
jgi:putative hydrolase of the HAD superfamily